MGEVPSSGHYISYAQRETSLSPHPTTSTATPDNLPKQRQSWYRFDDHSVREVTDDEALGCQAYILVYERMDRSTVRAIHRGKTGNSGNTSRSCEYYSIQMQRLLTTYLESFTVHSSELLLPYTGSTTATMMRQSAHSTAGTSVGELLPSATGDHGCLYEGNHIAPSSIIDSYVPEVTANVSDDLQTMRPSAASSRIGVTTSSTISPSLKAMGNTVEIELTPVKDALSKKRRRIDVIDNDRESESMRESLPLCEESLTESHKRSKPTSTYSLTVKNLRGDDVTIQGEAVVIGHDKSVNPTISVSGHQSVCSQTGSNNGDQKRSVSFDYQISKNLSQYDIPKELLENDRKKVRSTTQTGDRDSISSSASIASTTASTTAVTTSTKKGLFGAALGALGRVFMKFTGATTVTTESSNATKKKRDRQEYDRENDNDEISSSAVPKVQHVSIAVTNSSIAGTESSERRSNDGDGIVAKKQKTYGGSRSVMHKDVIVKGAATWH